MLSLELDMALCARYKAVDITYIRSELLLSFAFVGLSSIGLILFLEIICLAVLIYGLSVLTLCQVLLRSGPSTQDWLLESYLHARTRSLQQACQKQFAGRVGTLILRVLYPMSMIAASASPSDAVSELYDSPVNDNDDSNAFIQRLAFSWRKTRRLYRHRLRSRPECLNSIPGSRVVLSATSKILWLLVESSVADAIVLSVTAIISSLTPIYRWTRAFGIALLLAPVIDMALLYDRSSLMACELKIMMSGLLAPLIWPLDVVNKNYTEANKSAILAARQRSCCVYDLPVITTTGQVKDMSRQSSFRLITLIPKQAGNDMACALEVADFFDPKTKAYEALSYVWGAVELSETIRINGIPFHVSRTLFRILLHLRHETRPRTLWIDAICINQADLSERSSQVLLMRQVFSQASSVIVWLANRAPWGCDYVVESLRQHTTAAASSHSIKAHYGTAFVVSKLLREKYWTRVWVVQEVVLARDVKLHCGDQIIDWNQFCFLVDRCTACSYFPQTSIHLEEFRSIRETRDARTAKALLVPRIMVNTNVSNPQSTPDFLSIVYHFRSRQASDGRDKVFAFQSLVEQQKILADSTIITGNDRPLLQPDYNRNTAFLTIDFARAHIRQSRKLSAMALAECASQRRHGGIEKPSDSRGKRGRYIPSWCPAIMDAEAVKQGMNRRPLWTGLAGTPGEKFSAADNLPIRTPAVDSPLIPRDLTDKDAMCWGYHYRLEIDVLPALRSTITVIYPVAVISTDDLINAAMSAMRWGSTNVMFTIENNVSWKAVLPAWRRAAAHAYRQCASGMKLTLDEYFCLTTTAGQFSYVPSTSPEEQTFMLARENTCAGRRLFLTTDNTIGLGPADIQVGDRVEVALGSQVPIILRHACRHLGQHDRYPRDHDWLYIGQAYVHNLMVYRGDLQEEIRSGVMKLNELSLV